MTENVVGSERPNQEALDLIAGRLTDIESMIGAGRAGEDPDEMFTIYFRISHIADEVKSFICATT